MAGVKQFRNILPATAPTFSNPRALADRTHPSSSSTSFFDPSIRYSSLMKDVITRVPRRSGPSTSPVHRDRFRVKRSRSLVADASLSRKVTEIFTQVQLQLCDSVSSFERRDIGPVERDEVNENTDDGK